ncbi:hypothetical protein ThrDRAFT_04814 [Frankia casuarinae]|uniref:Polymerase nucleotidyl transferase domain-containing protein n=1 Tax=Frankia casuarinae (strain DSM 45818 / CECT 9043 / HFP020203 / CcI3) TaxID=106370 RepID=Q2J9H2_FRACC|nr:hypothetical protein [Frankia casuarinae]ABD12070.1 hypothetical protein Francci3_2709 [Frankia casuarinae]EYT89568.1 hypothetical protein ThrDRAFT_04814 [Frankia casuarinae]
MTGIAQALADAGRLRAEFLGPRGYAIAYGSHAAGSAAHDADLDLLFVGPPLSESVRARLADAVIALHATHLLRLDTEVQGSGTFALWCDRGRASWVALIA